MDGRGGEDGGTGDEGIEALLQAALRARASTAISDARVVPPMSEPVGPAVHRSSPSRHRSQVVWAALVTAAVIVAVVVATSLLVSHQPATSGVGTVAAGPVPPSGASQPARHSVAPSPGTSASRSSGPPPKVVKVTSDLNDGEKVGIGEPIVFNFSPSPTNSTAFTKAVTVTVNGKPATGAWYWERPYAGEPIQAHYREARYWPPNSTIRVSLPIGGLSAGRGRVYAGRLKSVTFKTGDAHVSTVDGATLQMTVSSNGHLVKTVPVSLGAAATPTFNGTKIVMQKGENVPGSGGLRPNGTVMMSGPGYTNDPVPWSVRVTASGEYVHAAGWNTQIGVRSTSNGCTNLTPADGEWFYKFSLLGDVVRYANISDGAKVNPLDGLGDWNIPWGQWAQGGQLINH